MGCALGSLYRSGWPNTIQCCIKISPDPVGCSPQRIVVQMSMALSRARLRMSEKLADNWKAEPESCCADAGASGW
jgi:hypothetical protein